MIKTILTLTCCLFFTLTGMAKVYKVAGADEFKKAADAATAGDEILIANGNYSNWEQSISTNATAGKPLIIRAETTGKVVFNGDVSKPVFLLTGSYIQISGLNFEACNITKGGVLMELKASKNCRINQCAFTKNVVKTQFTPIVIISGMGEYNRVDHCSFTSNVDNQEVQIKITKDEVPQFTLVDHNLFRDKAKVSWANSNGGECVQVGQDPILLGTRSAHTTVRDNRFIHCDGEAEVISNKSSDNRYSSNYFEDCKGELVMRGGHDCVIDSNTFKGGSGGIRVNGTGHTITNNQISDIKTAIRLMYGMAKGKTETGFYIAAANCTIKNNHISNAEAGIYIGDSKNADWTGKFDVKRYPSRTMQDVAPVDNVIADNKFSNVKAEVVHNEQ